MDRALPAGPEPAPLPHHLPSCSEATLLPPRLGQEGRSRPWPAPRGGRTESDPSWRPDVRDGELRTSGMRRPRVHDGSGPGPPHPDLCRPVPTCADQEYGTVAEPWGQPGKAPLRCSPTPIPAPHRSWSAAEATPLQSQSRSLRRHTFPVPLGLAANCAHVTMNWCGSGH